MDDPKFETSQSSFWRGEFGDAYTERNLISPEFLSARIALWGRIMETLAGAPPESILEVGANLGINLQALGYLTSAELFAVEPNALARAHLLESQVVPADNIKDCLAHDLNFREGSIDLVFTSGVLIHIHPENLLRSCSEIYRVSRRYIVCIEYFSDKPEEIPYRGHEGVLFKRDFGSFWIDNFPDLETRDYGFVWKRVTGLDNLTWWVFEKPV